MGGAVLACLPLAPGLLPAAEPGPAAGTDPAPRLAVDPVSGTLAAVWSRHDGIRSTITYARFESGLWVDFHDLTFGPGNDREPRIGFDRSGAWLFWVTEGGRYLYAPIDLSRGRLHAVPRSLPGSLAASGPASGPRTSGDLSLDATDAPIPPTKTCKGDGCTSGSSLLAAPGDGTVQATDAPIPPGRGNPNGGGGPNPNEASAWGAGSDSSCGSIVLVVPARDGRSASVVRFSSGLAAPADRIGLPSPVPPGFGDHAALTYLPSLCE
jgi:hypothetical protein